MKAELCSICNEKVVPTGEGFCPTCGDVNKKSASMVKPGTKKESSSK